MFSHVQITDDDDTTANAQRLKHNFGHKARQFFGLYWALRHGKADEVDATLLLVPNLPPDKTTYWSRTRLHLQALRLTTDEGLLH